VDKLGDERGCDEILKQILVGRMETKKRKHKRRRSSWISLVTTTLTFIPLYPFQQFPTLQTPRSSVRDQEIGDPFRQSDASTGPSESLPSAARLVSLSRRCAGCTCKDAPQNTSPLAVGGGREGGVRDGEERKWRSVHHIHNLATRPIILCVLSFIAFADSLWVK
jgi:hypothetical protein